MSDDIVLQVCTSGASLNDIRNVHDADTFGTLSGDDYTPNEPIASPRLAFIFIRNLPQNKKGNAASTLKRMAFTGEIIEFEREWQFIITDMTAQRQADLANDKYLTLPWGQAKNHIVSQVSTLNIVDSDIPG